MVNREALEKGTLVTGLLTVLEVAAILQVPVATLYQWRFKGEGPPSMRIGRHLRFDPADLAEWLQGRKEGR